MKGFWSLNNQFASIEIWFENKPEDAVLKKLRDNSFKWSSMNKLWYKKTEKVKAKSAELISFAKEITGKNEPELPF